MANDAESLTSVLQMTVNVVEDDDANIDADVAKDDDDEYEILTIALGDFKKCVLFATANGIVVTSTLQPLKTITFDVRRWTLLMTVFAKVDEAVTQLNRKKCTVAFHRYIGNDYYVSVKNSFACVDFRKFYLAQGMPNAPPLRLALRLNEWSHLFKLIPIINSTFPMLIIDNGNNGLTVLAVCF